MLEVRCSGSVFILCLAISISVVNPSAAQGSDQVDPLFAPLLEELQEGTSIPIRLPTGVVEIAALDVPLYAWVNFAEPTEYGIELEYSRTCLGARACNYGTFNVSTVSTSVDVLEGEEISLAKGIVGYFTDFSCTGAGCSQARIVWDQDGLRYYVGEKAGRLETLLRLANSTIENVPIHTSPQ